MITSISEKSPYLTKFSNGRHEAFSDTTVEKGGKGRGFRPHDLLEASLASCINMTVRMYAEEHQIPLMEITTRVSLNRETKGVARFEYHVELTGDLNEAQKARLLEAAEKCPLRKTLSGTLEFHIADHMKE